MGVRRRIGGWLGVLTLGVVASLVMATPATAQTQGPPLMRETGLRSGGGDGFDTFEFYYRQSAPGLQAAVLDRLGLKRWDARWDMVLGIWSGDHRDTAVAAIGPAVERRLARSGLRFSLGLQPTLLSRHDGNGKDLGGPLQFTSHVGIAWAPAGGLVLGLRMQHTSNARLYDSNPGVDIAAVEIGYAF
ncbi:acyloxyacyl hydrolase [Spiribacter sp. 221]